MDLEPMFGMKGPKIWAKSSEISEYFTATQRHLVIEFKKWCKEGDEWTEIYAENVYAKGAYSESFLGFTDFAKIGMERLGVKT